MIEAFSTVVLAIILLLLGLMILAKIFD